MELERGDFVTLSHPLIPGPGIQYGLVLPGTHILGSGKAQRMDGLNLLIRLLPEES